MLFLVSAALATATASTGATTEVPRDASGIAAALTTFLAGADSIDGVDARGDVVAFSIASAGEAYRITVTTRDWKLVRVVLADLGPAPRALRERTAAGFTWLAHALAHAQIATLAVAEDGSVTIATTTGEQFAVIRGATGNTAVAARWAAAWDAPDARE